ncbi:MAG: hypothetical protein ACYC4P_16935 [Thermoanaerobaculia bacterium]
MLTLSLPEVQRLPEGPRRTALLVAWFQWLSPEAEDPPILRRAGRDLLVIGPEALLADRLAAWKYRGSTIDAANAILLLRALGERLDGRLAARLARSLEVDDQRVRLTRFARRLAGRAPSTEELLRWLAGRARSR